MPQQRGDERVAARLLEHALARVDQDEREVGGRRAGDHVARVLHVAGRVGDDELAPRRGEVAVGDVDRDALLALGAQAVGEQREVRCSSSPRRSRGPLDVPRAGPRRSAWSRRAGGRSAWTCRRRPSRRWRSGAARIRRLGGSVRRPPSEVALALAVFHRRLGDAVVGAGRAALGDARGGDLGDDRRRASPRVDATAPVQRHVADGAVAHRLRRTAPRRRSSSTNVARPRRACRRAGRPRARGRSRSTAARAPPRAMYCQTSSSVQFESGNTRTCSPLRMRPL